MGNGFLYYGVKVTVEQLRDLGFEEPELEVYNEEDSFEYMFELGSHIEKWFTSKFQTVKLVTNGSCCNRDYNSYFIVIGDFGGICRGHNSCVVKLPKASQKDNMKIWCRKHGLQKPKLYIIANDCDNCS